MQIYSPFRRWTCGRIINTLSTYQPIENLFSRLPLQFEWIGTSLRELMWIAFICNRPSWYTYELLKNSLLTIVSYCWKAKFLSIFWSPSWLIKYWRRKPYKTIFTTFLLVDFLYVIVLLNCNVVARLITWTLKNTTLSNGYLGSRNDEERSEMRYVMRIAEFSESSNLWTQIALLGSPRSTPLSVSVQQSLSSVFG